MRTLFDPGDSRCDILGCVVRESDFAADLAQLVAFSLPFIAISPPLMTDLWRGRIE